MKEFSTALNCPHFSHCSGCQLETPPFAEEINKYFGFEVPIIHTGMTGWRIRSKLPVRGIPENPVIGLFKRGTHDVFEIPLCAVHHPHINKACALVKEKMKQFQIAPYDEINLTGTLRYIQLVVERTTGKVQLALVLNQSHIPADFCEALWKEELFHSIWANAQTLSTNRIFGDEWQLIHGQELLWETLNGTDIAFHPACFGQAHLSLFEQMAASIKQSLLPDKHTLELFAGVGAIGLPLADKCASLTCTEINPFAKICFEAAQKKSGGDASFKILSAEASLPLIDEAQVVIVDPPRKGLEPKVLEKLKTSESLEQIIYVSCGFRSFQRDADALIQAGWKIEKAEAYLLFPGTDHLETICVFEKR